jgi:hypothetical protein
MHMLSASDHNTHVKNFYFQEMGIAVEIKGQDYIVNHSEEIV